MNVNIQSQGIAGGHNSGSCGGYANYLEHENKEKVEAGMEDQQIPFFNPFAEPVGREEVVKSVDMNTGQLHRDDAKFYSVILSFSDEEVKALGNSRDEVLANVHNVVENTMDLYAENFHCEGVESHADLKYYYTIHEYRDGFTPGLHVHIIVSRKDATNTFKLSPRTNHRRGSSGVIKCGFDRDTFYRSCERVFDKATGFDRSLDKSYDYFNTMKHGSIVAEAQKRSSVSQLRNLIEQAKRISADIERLKVKQEGLKMAKDDTLKSYIAVKDERETQGRDHYP